MGNDDYLEIDFKQDKIVLPSEKNKKQKNSKKTQKFKKKLKWSLIIIFLILIYLFYNQIILYFFDVLKSNPTIYSYYLYIESQITNNTLKGLIFVSFLGSLFFLALPAEALFIYYLSSTEYFFGFLIIIMVFGNLLGMFFNYLFGRLMGRKVLKLIFGEDKYYTYQEKINNYGGYVLLFGNILPGPIELLAVFFGGFKFKLSRYLYLSFIGRLIKFIIIFLVFYFLWDYVMIYYEDLINNISVLSDLYSSNFLG